MLALTRDLRAQGQVTERALLLAAVGKPHAKFRKLLREVEGEYDTVFIDCPPSIGLLTFNALTAAHEAIIPVDPSYFSLHGLTVDTIVANRAHFGDFDPFGDFNLLFGSALLGLRIRDVPVRYKDRTYGETNISRFRHGASSGLPQLSADNTSD